MKYTLLFFLCAVNSFLFAEGIPAEQNNFFSHIILAMTAGFFALLTPCVFPMIPITVSYFTKRSEVKNKKAVIDALVFAIAIIVTFSLIGFIVSLIFGATGITRLAANPWINLFIAIIFLTLAANLFGFFEIRLPSKLLNFFEKRRLQSEQKSQRYGVTILMAFIFTLTTFTCTVPFMGSVLVSASRGSILFPLAGMFAFALIFSLPFFLLALFPSFLSRLPRSGQWLHSTKIIMGFLELAAALKFISNIDMVFQWEWLTKDIFLILLVVVGILLSLYLLGVLKFHDEDSKQTIKPVRFFLLLATISYTIFLASAINTNRNLGFIEAYLPPNDYGRKVISSSASDVDALTWISNYQQGKEKAALSNKPIFIDFTGYTCTNCRYMEQNMFTRDKVKQELEKFILIKLYTDGYDEESKKNQKLQEEMYKTVSLPLYAIIDSYGNKIKHFEGMTTNEQKFINFLKTITAEEEHYEEDN